MVEAVVILGVIVLGLGATVIHFAKVASAAKERERQAGVDFDASQKSEDVAASPGPATGNLGEFWNRLRTRK